MYTIQDLGRSKRDANTLYDILEMFRKDVYRELPIQQLSLYLLVVRNEGITMKDISDELSIHQASVSRNVKELSNYALTGADGERIDKGHGLLFTAPNEYNRREYSVFLTAKGRRVAGKMEEKFT